MDIQHHEEQSIMKLIPVTQQSPGQFPLFVEPVSAGFPSVASDYVDEFIDYWNSNYDNNIKQYTIYSSEFERDHGLVVKFVNNYN